jgi:lipoprotein-releasing system permease protein
MFSGFEWMMAMRYLRARRQEGFISVIAWFSLAGIALGVAVLIIVLAVMNGFRQEILTKILGLNGHLSVYGSAAGITDYLAARDDVLAIDGVVAVTPIVEGQVMLSARGVTRAAVVRGIAVEDLSAKPLVADTLLAGSLDEFAGGEGVLVGARLAERMGLAIGTKLTMVSPKGRISAFGSVPRIRAYPVAGIFEAGMYQYDDNFVFMPLAAAQSFFQFPEAVFNIITGITMLVKTKGRDIAILRSMGATQGRSCASSSSPGPASASSAPSSASVSASPSRSTSTASASSSRA